ncbi:hypothetical protein Tco_0922821 [Tanacetum coccineum]|uniref:Uncharacterized protein n=1 Tax=Tanacetum coccineum TaxID=301880 RepID=A0ABQ5D217_9ASTR
MANISYIQQLELAMTSQTIASEIRLAIYEEISKDIKVARDLTKVCKEISESVGKKQQTINYLRNLHETTTIQADIAYLTLIRDQDLKKTNTIMQVICEIDDHIHQKYVFIDTMQGQVGGSGLEDRNVGG